MKYLWSFFEHFPLNAERACLIIFSYTLHSEFKYSLGGLPVHTTVFYCWPTEYLGVKCLEQGHFGIRNISEECFFLTLQLQTSQTMLTRRTVLCLERSHRVVGKTGIVQLLFRMSVRRDPMPPWTLSLLVSILAVALVHESKIQEWQSCHSAELCSLMGFISLLPQTRGRMMRSMSVMWAGRPFRQAATSWHQRRLTGI